MNGRLYLNQAGLQEAIANYKKACEAYESVLNQFKGILNLIKANWRDQVGLKFDESSNNVLKDLGKVEENLMKNIHIFDDIAQKSSETQMKAYSEVNRIM